MNRDNLDRFTLAYFDAAIWADLKDEDGNPLDGYDIEDFSQESFNRMVEDCVNFQKENKHLLDTAYDTIDYTPENAGHDFWFTRNGHGAGFWDRGLKDVGQRLTKAAKVYGSIDIYIGDDDLIWIS